MTIDLRPFCMADAEYNRWDVGRPWMDGRWRYATDLSILVRVRIPSGFGRRPDRVPDAASMFNEFDAASCIESLPEWDGSTYDHQVACDHPQCHNGVISGGRNKCPACEGRGWNPESLDTTLMFHGFQFSGSYLRNINALPGVKGCVKDLTLPGSVPTGQLNFIFDGGGQGLLMSTTSVITIEGIAR